MSETFLSAHMTVLLAVFAIAFVMGAIVNKTNFCTMGAVSDWVNMGDTGRFRAWDILSVDKTLPPYRGSNFAWLEYVFGGFLFGIGMTLGSGCGNKTLIRIGGGNLKSIIVFAVIAVFAYFMINPFPGTDATIYSLVFYPWTNPTTVSMSGAQDIGSVVPRTSAAWSRVSPVARWTCCGWSSACCWRRSCCSTCSAPGNFAAASTTCWAV